MQHNQTDQQGRAEYGPWIFVQLRPKLNHKAQGHEQRSTMHTSGNRYQILQNTNLERKVVEADPSIVVQQQNVGDKPPYPKDKSSKKNKSNKGSVAGRDQSTAQSWKPKEKPGSSLHKNNDQLQSNTR